MRSSDELLLTLPHEKKEKVQISNKALQAILDIMATFSYLLLALVEANLPL